jgi:RNA polymerase sigma factor (sigma-70 family)
MSAEPTTSHFARLLERIRAGDESAKDDLVNASNQRVQALTHYILRGDFPAAGPGLETGDIANISLLKFTEVLRKGLDQVPVNPRQLFGLVGTIIRRTAIDEVRKRLGPKGQAEAPGALPPEVADPKAAGFEQQVLYRLAWQEEVGKLSEEEQELVNARYLLEQTYDEIAAELGCDPRTVSKRILAILQKLRERLPEPA